MTQIHTPKSTPQENEAIEELKRRTEDILPPSLLGDETLFYRFLKARDFDVQNAEVMLRKHIAWRKEWKIDTILEDYRIPEVVQKYFAMTRLGFDKDGNIVRYIDYGNSDLRGLLASARTVDHIKYVIFHLEKDLIELREQSKKLGKLLMTVTYIFNFENLTFSNAMYGKALRSSLLFAKIYLDNYPERMKNLIFINVSNAFKMGFAFVKPVFPATMQQKMMFFTSEGYKDYFREVIDEETLPAFLGGSRADPDGNPRCNTFVIHGQTVPKKYYLQERRLSQASDVKKLSVPWLSKKELFFEVPDAGSNLEWEFETMNRDIGFAVLFKEDEHSSEIIPHQRVDTCNEPGTGLYKCERPGTYIIVFDNSYSWLHTKDVYYRIRVSNSNSKEETQWTGN